MEDLIERLRGSAKAFRENTVYDSEGDPIRLIVQANECDEAANHIVMAEAMARQAGEVMLELQAALATALAEREADRAEIARLREALRDVIDECENSCPSNAIDIARATLSDSQQ